MVRPLLACALLLALLHLARSSEEEMDHHQLELKRHYDHLSYIAEFKCHVPQPRVIPVHKLFPESETHGKAYYPDVTVLHRCEDDIACCTSGQLCVPMHTETIDLPFKVTFLEEKEHHKVGSWVIEDHSLVNETECHCVDPPPPIKEEPLCVELRATCGVLASSCSKLQTTCPLIAKP